MGNPCGNLLWQSKTLSVACSLPAIKVAEEERLYKRLRDLQQADKPKPEKGSPQAAKHACESAQGGPAPSGEPDLGSVPAPRLGWAASPPKTKLPFSLAA